MKRLLPASAMVFAFVTSVAAKAAGSHRNKARPADISPPFFSPFIS